MTPYQCRKFHFGDKTSLPPCYLHNKASYTGKTSFHRFADDIFRCIFGNEKFGYWLKFHLNLFLNVQLTKNSIGLDNGLAPSRRQAIIWNIDGWFTDAYMRHLASMRFKINRIERLYAQPCYLTEICHSLIRRILIRSWWRKVEG